MLSTLSLNKNQGNCLLQIIGSGLDLFWEDLSSTYQDDKFQLIYKDSNKKSFDVGYCETTKFPYHVTINRRAGRQEISCSCTNHSKFPNALCSHKRAAITLDTMQGIKW